MLCSTCLKVFSGPVRIQCEETHQLVGEYLRPHHEDLQTLADASLGGCRICSNLLRHFFQNHDPTRHIRMPAIWLERNLPYRSECGTLYRFRKTSAGAAGQVLLDFILKDPLTTKSDSYASKDGWVVDHRGRAYSYIIREFGKGKSFASFLANVSNYATRSGPYRVSLGMIEGVQRKKWQHVDDWLKKCQSHSLCQVNQAASQFWPTRLLYLPYGPLPANPRYILLETAIKSPVGWGCTYATVSHCWGEEKCPTYRTTKANLAERVHHGIDHKDLPPTFQDAVDVARLLRISYLWIDSLCIIQEDDRDWAFESSRMADIYQNATINLSATCALSSQDGFAPAMEYDRMVVPATWTGDLTPAYYQVWDSHFWFYRVARTKLNTRGWVVPERILAKSVLHFSFDQLIWECCELVASEEFPSGLPSALETKDSSFKKDLSFLRGSVPLTKKERKLTGGTMQREDVLGAWHRIVAMYSGCDLSEPGKDKLVAISSIARAVQVQFDAGQYLAGIWTGNLIGDLLWRVEQVRRRGKVEKAANGETKSYWEHARREKQYCAPSWSWVSMDAVIRPGRIFDPVWRPQRVDDDRRLQARPLATIKDAGTTLHNQSHSCGQVTAGYLRVRGRCYRIPNDKVSSSQLDTIYRTSADSFRGGAAAAPRAWSVYLDQPMTAGIENTVWFLPLVRLTWIRDANRAKAPAKASRGVDYHIRNSFRSGYRELDSDKYENHDVCQEVVGMLVSFKDQQASFSRVGLAEVQPQELDQMDAAEGAQSLQYPADLMDGDALCSPEMALEKGDIIDGTFEII